MEQYILILIEKYQIYVSCNGKNLKAINLRNKKKNEICTSQKETVY